MIPQCYGFQSNSRNDMHAAYSAYITRAGTLGGNVMTLHETSFLSHAFFYDFFILLNSEIFTEEKRHKSG